MKKMNYTTPDLVSEKMMEMDVLAASGDVATTDSEKVVEHDNLYRSMDSFMDL